jgi:DNA recombination protein RmuC
MGVAVHPATWVVFGLALAGIVAALVLWLVYRLLKIQSERQATYFEERIRQEMRASQEQLLQLAGQQFSAEQNRAVTELETRKLSVDHTVRGLIEQLERYQQLVRQFEQDRERKYGNLEESLKNASLATVKLQETTHHLNNILGNVKLRGQWGERMAEDIIRYAGLIEGVNFFKQRQIKDSATKPDYTFLLPDEHKIHMDVKFPLDNYIKMANTADERQRLTFRDEFLKNVKGRIKELQQRDYINPQDNTLDFVLLFIPNEQVFGVIHDEMPDLLDTALQQKVVICSPFTLYAMLSVIRQAYENFRYEKDLKKILQLIDQFAKIYQRFKGRFEEIGVAIEKLEEQYQDVKTKSFQQLDTKIRHIDAYKQGQKPLTPDPSLTIGIPKEEIHEGIAAE